MSPSSPRPSSFARPSASRGAPTGLIDFSDGGRKNSSTMVVAQRVAASRNSLHTAAISAFLRAFDASSPSGAASAAW